MEKLPPYINDEIDLIVKEKILTVISFFRKKLNIDIPFPPVRYDITGTKAGVFKPKSLSIHLHPKLFLDNYQDFITNTIPHEVCHLIVHMIYLDNFKKDNKTKYPKSHGNEWKKCMNSIGLEPKVTHNYDTSKYSKTKKHQYLCACEKTHQINKKTHLQIVNKIAALKCKTCKTELFAK